MRVLVLVTPVSTHFAPMVPLAWALRAAGHDVLVAGQPDVMGEVTSAGLCGVSIGHPFHINDMLLTGLKDGQRPIEARPRLAPEQIGGLARVWLLHVKYVLPDYLDLARAFQADLILSDPLEYSALIVGGVLGLPVVQHRWGVDPIPTAARPEARTGLKVPCARLGLDELPDPTVLLDPCPPTLQLPDVEKGTPIRCVPYNGGGLLSPSLADSLRPPPGSESRRVMVCLGSRTLDLNGVPHLRRILRVFDGMPDTEAIAPVHSRHRAQIGPVPANVRMIEPTPLHLILGDCAAVVHHGGAGTSMTCTAFGLPQLVLPQMADQFAAGDQIAVTGAGITIDDAARQDDPAELRSALSSLLAEARYREAARELREEMNQMPAPAEVVSGLERSALIPGKDLL